MTTFPLGVTFPGSQNIAVSHSPDWAVPVQDKPVARTSSMSSDSNSSAGSKSSPQTNIYTMNQANMNGFRDTGLMVNKVA